MIPARWHRSTDVGDRKHKPACSCGVQQGQTSRVFEAQPAKYALTSSYELCHCSRHELVGRRPGVHRLDAQSLGRGCDIKLDLAYIYRVIDVPPGTLNEGLKGFRANLKPR